MECLSLQRLLAPEVSPFMPNLENILELPYIAMAVDPDREATVEVFTDVECAVLSSIPDMERWMHKRIRDLQTVIPDTWVRPPSTSGNIATVVDSPSKLINLPESLLSFDLAVYAFKCPLGNLPSEEQPSILDRIGHGEGFRLGLDAAAHQCSHVDPTKYHFIPVQEGYDAALQILGLLGLDPFRTTLLDMDQLDPYFVCTTCTEDPGQESEVFGWRGAVRCYRIHPSNMYRTDYRAQVLHACHKYKTNDPNSHRQSPHLFAKPPPLLELYCRLKCCNPRRSRAIWGCAYCSAHCNRMHSSWGTVVSSRWFTHAEVAKHLDAE
jgi:hypothetical protein